MFRAVLPMTHPPHVKPMIIVSAADATQAQKTSVFVGRAAFHLSERLKLRLLCSIGSPPLLGTL